MKKHIYFKIARKIFHKSKYTLSYVQLNGQEANDYIRNEINKRFNNNEGLMVSKFGTTELDNVCCWLVKNNGIRFSDYINGVQGQYVIYPDDALDILCSLSGFFPHDMSLWDKYVQTVLNDISDIDILASYIRAEKMIKGRLSCKNVDLDGFLAPFLWKNPWTAALKDKRVLVIHPFTTSIKKQYERRKLLFDNPEILPEFKELLLIKAVQSIANNGDSTGYKDWFDALESMERQIDKYDFDVALVGCGAYAMELTAYIKRKGKIALHTAGWTQMIFGIYGQRWTTDQSGYSRFINQYWVRPDDSEKPENANDVENGCYW